MVALQVVGAGQATLGFSTGSDKRWKKDITPLVNSLDKVMRLQGVNYNFRTSEFPELKFTTDSQIGLIAQDVEKVVPEVVHTSSDGYKNIEYGKLVSVLIESLKELKAQNDALELRLKALEQK